MINKTILVVLLLIFSLNSLSQKTIFGGMVIHNFDSISIEEKTEISKRDTAFENCKSDTCRLKQLYGAGNLIESLEIQDKICDYSLNLIEERLSKNIPSKAIENELKRYRIKFLSGKGSISMDGGNFTKSIKYLSKCIKAANELKDTILMIEGYNNLGYVNYMLVDMEGANKFYKKAATLAENAYLQKELPILYLNIFSAYGKLDSLEKALIYANKIFDLEKGIVDSGTLLITYNNLALFYKEMVQNNDSAFHYYNKTIALAEEMNNLKALYISKTVRAKLFEEQNDIQKAEKGLEEVLEICRKMEDEDLMIKTYHSLYEIKQRTGKYQESLEYRNKEIELKEKLGKKEDIQSLSDIEANLKYENELILKEERAQSLEKESQLKSNIIYLAIGSTLLIGLALVFLFVNRRKLNQSKLRLEELDKVNKQIFSVIAHDFKEPIINFNTLLGHISNKENLDGEFVDELESQVKSSSDVLNNLLNWARVELEKQEVNKKKLNLKQLWEKVVSNMETSIKKKGLVIKNLMTENDSIEGDAVMMEIVFRNLLSNAVKFSPEGGEITLKKNKDTIEIIDQGIGMNASSQESLFKEKVNPGYGTKGEIGFGIGLFIVKNLLGKNGKTISFSANNPNGTIFAIQES